MRIAAYCRVSTEKEEQIDSLEHQKEFFTEYAERNNHKLVRLYADEGISGMSLKKRDEFKRLMCDAHLGLFDAVVVKDISRFARNTVDFLQNIRMLKALGINTFFLTANMESLGESEFVLTLFSALAQEESINLSKRVKFGKKINAKKGRVPQRVYGYNRIDNYTLEINPKEAKVVQEIFRLYLEEGLGCRKISMTLNALGSTTKFGCEWNGQQVRRVLKNSIYCGKYINNKYEIGDCLEGKQVKIPEEQHFHHDRPEWAIITEDVFNKAQDVLQARRRQYDSGPPFLQARHSSKHIFSTLIRCEHCGYSYRRVKRNSPTAKPYWICSCHNQNTGNRCDNNFTIREADLLGKLRSYFSSLIKDLESFTNGLIANIEKQNLHFRNAIDVKEIESKRKRLLAKKDKYQEMYVADVMTMSELKEKMNEINDQLLELDYSLAQYEQSLIASKDAASKVEEYKSKIERFLTLESITNMEMREVIDHITINVHAEIKIYLKNLQNSGTIL